MKIRAAILTVCLSALASLATAGEVKPFTPAAFSRLTAKGAPVLVDVHAPWCPTCRAQEPIISALAATPAYRDVTVLVVDFDTQKDAVTQFKARAQSTLIAYHGLREVGRSVGDTTRPGIEALIQTAVR